MREEYKWLTLIVICALISYLVIVYLTISYIEPSYELQSCDTLGVSGYCIDVQFKTTIDEDGIDISEFSFPHYLRQGDYLWVDAITIIKKPTTYSGVERKIFGSILRFNIIPTEGHLEKIHGSNYGKFDTQIKREINVGDKYEIKRMENRKYYHYFNGEKINNSGNFEERHHEIELYRVGEWYIDFDAEGNLTGYSTLFNGRWAGDVFYIYPRHEIENSKSSYRSMKVGIMSVLAMLHIFIIQLAWGIINKKYSKDQQILDTLIEIRDNTSNTSNLISKKSSSIYEKIIELLSR